MIGAKQGCCKITHVCYIGNLASILSLKLTTVEYTPICCFLTINSGYVFVIVSDLYGLYIDI
jgi:hypothetical protein